MQKSSPPKVLTIAGSDPSGGAGIEADLKVITAHGCYGMTTITALTAQNTKGVRDVHIVPPEFVSKALQAVLDDITPDVIKTGMLATADTINTVMDVLGKSGKHITLVVDPVMIATSGSHLLENSATATLIKRMIPDIDLLTPNAPEAIALLQATGNDFPPVKNIDDLVELARRVKDLGPKNVLVKGGHCAFDAQGNVTEKEEDRVKVINVLYADDGPHFIESSYISSKHTHGTGCSLASAIASNLAKGISLVPAVEAACTYISNGIATAPGLGAGNGPINHLHSNFMTPFAPGKFIDYLIGHPDVKAKWKAYTQHDFVKQLGAGTLNIEAFKFYLIQDYLFLIQFARANALAAYKCHNMDDIAKAAEITMHCRREMQLHVKYCAGFGITEDEMKKFEESAACTAYTRYTLDIGTSRDFLSLQVAMIPCAVGYEVIARELKNDPATKREGNPYWEWIESYASDEYVASVASMRAMVENKMTGMGTEKADELVKIFAHAVKLEDRFWEDALHGWKN